MGDAGKPEDGPPRPPLSARLWVLLVILVVGVGLDQWTKQLARDYIEPWGPQGRSYLGDTVRLVFALNRGAFLGLGGTMSAEARYLMFVVLNTIFLIGVTAWALKAHRLRALELHSLAWIISGGIGNLIDRVAIGAVTDFVNLGIGSLRTGIFNVADVAITGGVLVLFIAGFGADDEDAKKS